APRNAEGGGQTHRTDPRRPGRCAEPGDAAPADGRTVADAHARTAYRTGDRVASPSAAPQTLRPRTARGSRRASTHHAKGRLCGMYAPGTPRHPNPIRRRLAAAAGRDGPPGWRRARVGRFRPRPARQVVPASREGTIR